MARLTFVSPVFPYPNRGVYTGIERQIEGLCTALVNEGAEVEVVTSFWNGGQAEDYCGRVRIHRVRDLRLKLGKLSGIAEMDFLSLGYQAYLHLRRCDDADAIIYNMPFPFSRFIERKSALFVHHLQPLATLSQVLSVPFGEVYFRSTKVDLYLAPSRYTAVSFGRRFGINPEKLRVIHEGAEVRFASGDGRRVREKVGGGKLVLYVGNLSPSKGVIDLIEAFTRTSRELLDCKLILVGEGSLRRLLERKVERLGLEGKVFFEGFVTDMELPNYYAACDVFASFSRIEGFGLIFAEAMMAGKPIVALKSASIPEVVGPAGILVPPDDAQAAASALTSLLRDDELRERLAQRAKERSREFRWESSARKLLEVLG